MGIPARTREPGFHSFLSTRKGKRDGYSKDGQYLGTNEFSYQVCEHVCRRKDKQKGAYVDLGGVKFRQPTPYFQHVSEFAHSPGQIHTDSDGTSFQYDDVVWSEAAFGIFTIDRLWMVGAGLADENLQSQAEVECLNKLGGAKAELGTMIAEAKETANLLADTSSMLARSLLAFKHRQFGKIPRILGINPRRGVGSTAADYWLQYQYGWRPLMSDIKSLHDLLLEKLNRRLILHASHTARNTRDLSHRTHNLGGYDLTGTATQSSRVTLWASVTGPALANAQRLGLINPLQIGWELVPYSFVLDWFMPVGSTLAALTATHGLGFLGGSHTFQTTIEGTFTGRLGPYQSGKPIEVKMKGFGMERQVYTDFPVPSFYVEPQPFSTHRILNALALIRQLF